MKKKIMCFGLSFALFLIGGKLVANASELKEPDKTRESGVLNELAEGNNIQTRDEYTLTPHIHGTCVVCSNFCFTVCAAEGVVGDTWTHSTIFTKDCNVTQLRSRAASICGTCGNVNEQYGYHDCWEAHTKCSKGQYDVCPMDVS